MTEVSESSAAGEQSPSRRGLAALVARGSTWQATAQLMPLAVNILLTPIIIAGLGIDRYGLFLLANVIATVLAATDGGIFGAAIRYFAVYAGQGDKPAATRLTLTTTSLVVVVGGIGATLFFWVADEVIALFREPPELLHEGTFLLRTLIITTAVAVLRNLFAANLNAHHRFALTSVTHNISYVAYIGGTLLTVAQGWGLYGMALTQVAQQLVTTALIIPAACRLLDVRAVRWMPKSDLREFLRYAAHMQWANIMLLVNLAADSIVIGIFLPVRHVAYYQTGANFALQVRNVPQNAIPPIEAVLGRTLGDRGVDEARGEFEWLQRLWVVATSGFGVVAMSAAWFGVTAWLGPEFSISGVVAVVVLFGYLFAMWAGVLYVWCQTLGRPDLYARSTTWGVVVNLVLTLALIVPFGILGTVTATAVGQLVAALLLLRYARAQLPGHTRSFLREVPLLPSLLAAPVVVGCELLLWPHAPEGAFGLLLCGLVAMPGLVVYVLVAFGLRAPQRLLRARLGRTAEQGPATSLRAMVDGPATKVGD